MRGKGPIAPSEVGPSPRVRGTRNAKSSGSPSRSGPSPRVRGTPQESHGGPGGSPVHPRVCGEHTPEWHGQQSRRPVHPRVCGEHAFPWNAFATIIRSIPACAGNTLRSPVTRQQSCGPSPRVRGTRSRSREPPAPPSVHPRVCGEHDF